MYHDLTLRDGSHAIGHKLSREMIRDYCLFAEEANISVIEVGHGCGLGASSILIGESLLSDYEMICEAKKYLKNTKLSVHIIPGIATLNRDVIPAIDAGVDIFRVATHCTEATLAKAHIEYLAHKGKYVLGVLMLSACCPVFRLLEEAAKMCSYGASGIVIMDSTGSFYPNDIVEIMKELKCLNVPLGFHGHDNLRLSVANSLAAIENGASIIDCTMKGFGGGAGNTPLEIMACINPYGVDVDKILAKCETFIYPHPTSKPVNILTAKHKLVSVFDKHIENACKKYNISKSKLVLEMEQKGLVAGQEDFINVLAHNIFKREEP